MIEYGITGYKTKAEAENAMADKLIKLGNPKVQISWVENRPAGWTWYFNFEEKK